MMHFGLDSAIDVNNNLNNNFALFPQYLICERGGEGTTGARTYAII